MKSLLDAVIPVSLGCPSTTAAASHGVVEPAGPAIVLRNTVAIAPSVTGEVIDVPVRQNSALKAGDVLFQIDPTPYEAAVKSLTAQLSVQEERLAIDTKLKERDVRPPSRLSSGRQRLTISSATRHRELEPQETLPSGLQLTDLSPTSPCARARA